MEFECLGACDRAPVVMVNNEHWHEKVRPEDAGEAGGRDQGEGREGLHRLPPGSGTMTRLQHDGHDGHDDSQNRIVFIVASWSS